MSVFHLFRLTITYDSITQQLELHRTSEKIQQYIDEFELIHNAQIERDVSPKPIGQVIFQHIPVTSGKYPQKTKPANSTKLFLINHKQI